MKWQVGPTLPAMKMLAEHIPGFEKCELRNFATTIGVRDTRKFVGNHDLCAHDVYEDGRFDAVVFMMAGDPV